MLVSWPSLGAHRSEVVRTDESLGYASSGDVRVDSFQLPSSGKTGQGRWSSFIPNPVIIGYTHHGRRFHAWRCSEQCLQ